MAIYGRYREAGVSTARHINADCVQFAPQTIFAQQHHLASNQFPSGPQCLRDNTDERSYSQVLPSTSPVTGDTPCLGLRHTAKGARGDKLNLNSFLGISAQRQSLHIGTIE
jgi:hypothetical protein